MSFIDRLTIKRHNWKSNIHGIMELTILSYLFLGNIDIRF